MWKILSCLTLLLALAPPSALAFSPLSPVTTTISSSRFAVSHPDGFGTGEYSIRQALEIRKQLNNMAPTEPSAMAKTLRGFQKDMRVGWLYRAAYWTIGALVGYQQGYFNLLFQPQGVSALHAIAFMVTLICRIGMNPRYQSYGRQPDPLGVLTFALCNGVLETFLFFYAYDLGRHTLATNLFGWQEQASCIFGFIMFYIYAGLIHIHMWQTKVLPRHNVVDAPFFPTHGLPFIVTQSMCWLALYEQHQDVCFVCLCHCLTNVWHGWHSAIPYTHWDANGEYLEPKPSYNIKITGTKPKRQAL